jgi:DNA-directed RNA polymerase subunit F
MKNCFILFVFILKTAFVFAQGPDPIKTGNLNMATSDEAFRIVHFYDGRYIELVGELYLNDTLYHTGELKTFKKLYTTELMYRFNQLERAIQVKMSDGKEMYIRDEDIVYCKIVIEDKTVTFMPESIPNGRRLTVIQVLYKSPRIQLYRDSRKYVYRVKSANLDGYSSEKIYDEVRKDYHYYLRYGDVGEFQEVKITAKSFAEIIPEKRTQINALFRAAQKKEGLTVTKLMEIMKELDKTTN